MLLRFVCEGVTTDFELFGAQAESVVGLFDAVRSAVLDLTADAVVLRDSTAAALAAMQAGGKDATALQEQKTAADLFAEKAVDLFVVRDEKAEGGKALLMRFPAGLGALAEGLASQVSEFAKELHAAYGLQAEATAILNGLDQEFDPEILPEEIEAEEIRAEGGGSEDADDLLPVAPPPPKGKSPKAKAPKAEKALAVG